MGQYLKLRNYLAAHVCVNSCSLIEKNRIIYKGNHHNTQNSLSRFMKVLTNLLKQGSLKEVKVKVSCCHNERCIISSCEYGLQAAILLALVLDKTPISGTGSHVSHQGSLFYASFASIINRHLVAVARDFVPTLVEQAVKEPSIVGSVLCGMLEEVATARELRKK